MNWIRHLFTRRRIYRDLSEEMRQHLDEKVDALVETGMPREQALATARREFGNATSLEERAREPWQWPTLESFALDIRYALRELRRQPLFTCVAVLILAIGIGANTAVFSVVNTLLFQPLVFRDAERLDWVNRRGATGRIGRFWTVAEYEQLREMKVFEDVTTYEGAFARSSYKLTGDGEPDRVAGVMVPSNFFPFLGVSPLLGRSFTEAECQASGPGAVILSHGLWQRRFGSRPDIVGRQVVVNDRAATIIGVMPPAFDFGAVFAPGNQIDVYMPAVFDVLREWGTTMHIIGRHRSEVTSQATESALNAALANQERDRSGGAAQTRFSFVVAPLGESIIGAMRRPMLTLWAAVALVLLIVCINLANLLLARATARQTEMALRSAIGAGRGRLIRQLLSESFILSFAGGGLGIGLAYLATAYLRRLEGISIPLLKNAEINMVALAIAAGVTIVTALLFGLAPAIASARGDLARTLKSGGRGSTEGRDQRAVRSVLVVAEVALACLLLISTGLLLRSFWHVLDIDLGFQAPQTYALRIDAGPSIDTREKFNAYLRGLMSAADAVPGVESASLTDAVPLDSTRSWPVRAQGQPADQNFGALIKMVGPGLMATMRTPIIAGREFTDRDEAGNQPVTIINEALAERLWPGQDAVMRTLMNGDTPLQVVGVVANVRHTSIEQPPVPEFYLSILQRSTASPSLVVRVDRPFTEVAPALRRALNAAVADLPTANFRPLQQLVDRAMSTRRFFVQLLLVFAAAALTLAAIGIYGVISYSVARRTSEIGVRMALGASSRQIRASVVGNTLRLALSGAVVGIAAAVAVSSLLASLLFGVSASDPWTYSAAAAVLLLVAIVAGAVPAIRASRISPMRALRVE